MMDETQQALDSALAILSLVTGDEWDKAKLVAQSSSLKTVAVTAMRKQGLTEADAETFVQDRWEQFAADIPQAEPAPTVTADPSPSTQSEGDLSATANLGASTAMIPTVAELGDRLAEYKLRKGLVTQEDPAPTGGTGSSEPGATGS